MSMQTMPTITVEEIIRYREEAIKIEQQRDELLAALKAITDPFSTPSSGDPSVLRRYAMQAVEKAEKQLARNAEFV